MAEAAGATQELETGMIESSGAIADAAQASDENRSTFDGLGGTLNATADAAVRVRDELNSIPTVVRTRYEVTGLEPGSIAGRTRTGTFSGARQHGGPVMAGHAYLVGEAGPEMFVPSQAGTVVSNQQMNQTNIGGDTITMNIAVQSNAQAMALAAQVEQRRRDELAGRIM
jgi:hypothetical protein